MGKRTPRRLKRFARQGIEPSEESMKGLDENVFSYSPNQKSQKPEERRPSGKEIAAELAKEEVQKFKETHKRLPEKKDYGEISESIYAQLKDKKKRKKIIERLERKNAWKAREKGANEWTSEKGEGTERKGGGKRKHGRPVRGKRQDEEKSAEEKGFQAPEPEEERTLSAEEIKGMSVEDLFSSEKNGKEKGDLGELEKIGGEGFSLEGIEDLEKSGAPSKCPKCGAETEEVIFCPECGTAFCEKCTKRTEMLGGIKTVVCPDCGKRIKKTILES